MDVLVLAAQVFEQHVVLGAERIREAGAHLSPVDPGGDVVRPQVDRLPRIVERSVAVLAVRARRQDAVDPKGRRVPV